MEDATIIDGFKNPESLLSKLRKSGSTVSQALKDAANKQRMSRYHDYKNRTKSAYYVCIAQEPVRLEEKVLEFINIGYEPTGGICFDGRSYYQAVYYPKKGRRGAKTMHSLRVSED